jgi:malate dehydrogenase (oxaloacetate-decarboxylating)(NADP+)
MLINSHQGDRIDCKPNAKKMGKSIVQQRTVITNNTEVLCEGDKEPGNLFYEIMTTKALEYHRLPKPGKISIQASKPLNSQEDLALAYSPGVAEPCLQIAKDESKIYEYTSRGNTVGVISNGTAVLGLGNIGAAASLPVMEGKAVLFKHFAGIDAIPVIVSATDPDEFINVVKNLEYSFGGINLEDIKAPDCFIIEQKLQELMNIPIFHDDQHGTAVIICAAITNVSDITGKRVQNITMCDRSGVIYSGREKGMNPWKIKYAIKTSHRTLAEAAEGADVLIGLSVKGSIETVMIERMNKNPVVFALANPDPEITPKEVHRVRPEAIVATGRSDYPNQVNNVMCFPYLFKGALMARARDITTEMKIAAAKAIASIARKEVPNSVKKMYNNSSLKYGPGYIIPTPFDPRLATEVSEAVVKAANSKKDKNKEH